RHADRFSIERIAARIIEQNTMRPESGRIAKDAAYVVVVRQPDQSDEDVRGALHVRQRCGLHRRTTLAEREDAAMDRKADDGVHDLLWNDVSRNVVRERSEDIGHRIHAPLLEEQRSNAELASKDEDAQDDHALCDEETFTPDEITLPHRR